MKDVAFKPQAFEKAAETLDALSDDVGDVNKMGGQEALEKISGVGKSIAEKIIEYLKTGKIKDYEKLKKEIPVNLTELTAVEGVGPKTIRVLYEKLKIKNLADLEKAAKAGKIGKLENFGEKTEKNILQSIEFLKKGQGRILLAKILPDVREVEKKLRALKGVSQVSVAGSVRRMKETIGDIDILAAVKNEKDFKTVADFFANLPQVAKVIGKGETKISVQTKDGFNLDLRIVALESWGSALQYFTGSKEHNIATRKIAIDKGYKLNEYGLFDGEKKIAGETEEGVYEKLGMKWVPPEMRENAGEVELSLQNKLPKLIEQKDIKGDLHCHSHPPASAKSAEAFRAGWTEEGIRALVNKAMSLGYEYIGISDHTKFLHIEHGLNEKELMEENEFIKKMNSELRIMNNDFKVHDSSSKFQVPSFRILHGCEANIMPDGSIDISDEVLVKLDYVIAGVHSQMKMSKKEMTARVITAMRNPNVDIISHPTGRIIGRRDEFEIDVDEILRVAQETGTILEINAWPERLDLKDVNIRKAKEAGVKMVINTDAHQPEQVDLIQYGISQSRRGWAEKGDIINTLSVEGLLKTLKQTT